MRNMKDMLLRVVEVKARRRAAELAHQLIRAPGVDRELVLAGLQFEQWLAESCRDCLDGS